MSARIERRLVLSDRMAEVLRPLAVTRRLIWQDWHEQTGLKKPVFNYYRRLLLHHHFIATTHGKVREHGGVYEITPKGIMLYCALIDKPLNFLVEEAAQQYIRLKNDIAKCHASLKRVEASLMIIKSPIMRSQA